MLNRNQPVERIKIMELIERITFARERAGLSQTELAKKIGITPQAIQNWEYGKSSPRLQRLKKLAEVLNVSEEWITTGNGSFKRKKQSNAKNDKDLTDNILFVLDQLSGEKKKDALKIIKHIAEQQKLLNKYGL